MDRNIEKNVDETTGLEVDQTPFEHRQGRPDSHINEADDIKVELHEEEMSASVREVDRGAVQISKDVVTEEQTLEVPVTEERVNVQRRTVDRPVAAGDDAFKEGTIEVPVYGEEVDVQKQARVVEELEIDKEAVRATERVTGTVRREEVSVEGEVVDGGTSGTTTTGTTGTSGGGGLLDKAADVITGNTNKPRN